MQRFSRQCATSDHARLLRTSRHSQDTTLGADLGARFHQKSLCETDDKANDRLGRKGRADEPFWAGHSEWRYSLWLSRTTSRFDCPRVINRCSWSAVQLKSNISPELK